MPRNEENSVTLSGRPPETLEGGAPGPINPSTGQHSDYWILSDEERAKGFVRPVRLSYVHTACGAETRMAPRIAETYAREPGFYGQTFCVQCGKHLPVGADGEFIWDDGSKVGT